MRILFNGDSITDAGKDYDPAGISPLGQGYAFLVAAQLGFKYPRKFEFINQGHGGSRVENLIRQIDTDTLPHNPDLLSILIGVNDAWGSASEGYELNYEKIEKDFRDYLDKTIAKYPNVKIVILEPFVENGDNSSKNYSKFRSGLDNIAVIEEKIAKDYNIDFIKLQNIFDDLYKSGNDSYWLIDGIHPTHSGNMILANEWMKWFNQINT